MRAVTIPRPGPPSVLEIRDIELPEPGPGQLRIAVAAAGLNFAEIAARQGLYPDAPPFPCVVGYEGSGTVDAIGAGVDPERIGTQVVFLSRFGSHAESVLVDQDLALPLPAGSDLQAAAAIPVNYLTAHHMLFRVGVLHPGERVLLHMAAGGVGTAALQLMQEIPDITIFGTASPAKHDHLRSQGCHHPIDYRSLDYAKEVRRITDGQGVHLVLDPLGGADWKQGWDLLAPTGRLVAFGFANMIRGSRRNWLRVLHNLARSPRFGPMAAMEHNRSLIGVNMGHLWDEKEVLRPQMERLIELWLQGRIHPHIHAVLPFSQAAEAHRLLEERENLGKVLLVPDSSS
ncbi:MAG: medium chain dehydrogenase/reductase family protein [Myxococcota bacterium]|nr:medium chain dehydrogenase/reductase family protein [Myxococcota bacterium]